MSEIDKVSEYISMVTTTFYNPDIESDRIRLGLADKTMMDARRRGMEVICVDGGSSDEFLKKLGSYGVRVFMQEKKGIGHGRRQAIREAVNLDKEIIAFTEPEKVEYIRYISKTAFPILEGQADIVVPSRNSLCSYPTFQKYAEILGNMFWNKLTGIKLDMWFGPKTWRKDLSRYFLGENSIEEDHQFDYINLTPIMDALYEGKRIVTLNIDYVHPTEQTLIEENDLVFYRKRIDQLSTLTKQLETHWKKLHSSKVR